MSVVIQRHQFTVDDFARMVESGILGQDDRVELIDGEVREMSPIGSLHAAIVNRLNSILSERLLRRAIVSVQNPVILNDFTEPQPDLVILRPKEDFYKDALPTPADVLLLIEVADSTLDYDRDEKIPRYAEMRIPEVWLVDANGREVTQYATSNGDRYQKIRSVGPDAELKSLAIESLAVQVSEIFLIGPD